MDQAESALAGGKMPQRRTGVLQRPDCRIHYEVTGAGPAIVFAHGLGGNHLSWWQQVAYFAPRFTCVTFAHRGFAPSSPIPGGPDPDDYAGDLAALVAELGLTDFRLVAQSMGGWTGIEYALRKPGTLKAMVLAATTGSIDPQRLPEADRARVAAWAAAAERTQADLAARGIHPAAGLRMAREQPAMTLLYHQINDLSAHLDKQALRRRLMERRVRAPEELAGIDCPILMIANDEDSVMPGVAADGIARIVPGVRVAHIADAGHSAYFERPERFNQLIDDFFASLG